MKLGSITQFRARREALRYGNPSRALKLVIVDGAHGKTTTALLLAVALQEAGERVAVFTNKKSWIHDAAYEGDVCATHKNLEQALSSARQAGVTYAIVEAAGAIRDTHVLAVLSIHALLAVTETDITKRIVAGGLQYACVPVEQRSVAEQLDSHRLISFGEDERAEAWLKSYRELRGGTELTIVLDHHDSHEFATYLVGRANALNVTAAVALAYVMGSSIDKLIEGIADVEVVSGNLQTIIANRPYRVILDQAATKHSLELVLQTAHALKKRRLLVVLGRDFHDDAIEIAKHYADQISVYAHKPADGTVQRGADALEVASDCIRGARRDDVVVLVGREFDYLAERIADLTDAPKVDHGY